MELLVVKSIVCVAIAYCLGAISWAYVIGRLVRGVDMTEVGNGHIGAAFAIRKLGFAWGILVGLMDFLKGAVAIAIALVLEVPVIVTLLSGMAVVAGHNWSIFLGFKGGRGAAATFGALIVLVPIAFLLGFVIMATPFLATRRSNYLFGIRRTTLLFGVYMLVVSAILWLDMALAFMPVVPWWSEITLLTVALPPCLLILNVAGRPQARRKPDEFNNQTRLG